MNKADLVDAVAAAATIGKREVDQVVAEFIDQITRALQAGEKVTIAGLGAISTAATKPRMGRNPRTGVAARIPAGVRVKFTASSTLKRAVQTKAAAKKAPAKKSPMTSPQRATPAKKVTTKKTTAAKAPGGTKKAAAAAKPAARKAAAKKR